MKDPNLGFSPDDRDVRSSCLDLTGNSRTVHLEIEEVIPCSNFQKRVIVHFRRPVKKGRDVLEVRQAELVEDHEELIAQVKQYQAVLTALSLVEESCDVHITFVKDTLRETQI